MSATSTTAPDAPACPPPTPDPSTTTASNVSTSVRPTKAVARQAGVRPPADVATDERTYDLALLRRLLPFARESTWLFVVAGVLVPLSSLSSLIQPLLLRSAIDAALVDRSRAALLSVVGMYAVAIAVEFVAKFAQMYTVQLGGQRTIAELRRATYRRVERLPLSYFDKTPVGRIVTRVTNDADAIGELFASGAILGIADVFMLFGIVGFMLYLDPMLTVVAFLAVPPLLIAVRWIRVRARDAFREIRGNIAQLNAYLSEQVQGIATVQAFGREAECLREYEDINAAHRDANFRAIRYDALLYSVVESIASVTIAVLLWFGAVRVGMIDEVRSAAYVGTIVAFYEYVQRFFVPIRDLSQKYTILQSSLAAAERVFLLLDIDENDASARVDETRRPTLDGGAAIELDHVTFGYRADRPVLRDVSLAIARGEKIAVVGPTGSGKTTLTALALHLYAPQSGAVRIFGDDVRELSAAAVRSLFSVVSQDVFMFAGTVLENVSVFASSPDRARAEKALRDVGAWDNMALRGGLDAEVRERGSNFSAGERQLIAFARALYLDRPIFVLDEATANVDSETEAKLQRAVDVVMADRTALIIAHRLSTIRKADRIVVLRKGEVAEIGTHDELVAAGGLYARLHALQFLEAEVEASASA